MNAGCLTIRTLPEGPVGTVGPVGPEGPVGTEGQVRRAVRTVRREGWMPNQPTPPEGVGEGERREEGDEETEASCQSG